MKLIVGLGNPTKKYLNTRHNLGFMVIDKLLETLKIISSKRAFKSIYYQTTFHNQQIFLAKPLTYMNNSGKAVSSLLKGLAIKPDQLIVIHDDLDLPLGKIRIKKKGGTGGHNGLISIVNYLQVTNFLRIRIGIGRPKEKEQIVEYVLEPFLAHEKKLVNEVIETAVNMVLLILENNINKAMNLYH